MQLAIDIGNTFTKAGIFKENQIIEVINTLNSDNDLVNNVFSKYPSINSSIISSVKDDNQHIIALMRAYIQNILILDSATPLPIKNFYKTPETLGRDRIAGVVGASVLFPETDLFIIDFGTAITFDFISKDKEYFGGNISPGIDMRFKSLNVFTQKLPLVQKNNSMSFLGETTENAIISGVQNGTLFETEKYIEEIMEKHPNVKIILTGGDVKFFERNLKKNSIFVEENVVLIGLKHILNYNE